MFHIHETMFLCTSFNVSVIDDDSSCGSMADMTGEAEYSVGGQFFTVVSRSSWKEGLVVRATRATCTRNSKLYYKQIGTEVSKQNLQISTTPHTQYHSAEDFL